MSIRQVNAESSVAPNLVPMVDIMFLLLLFLMVGADMGNRELEDVKLPVAKSAVEEKKEEPAPDERITLNVYHCVEGCGAYDVTQLCTDRKHWAIGARGNDYRTERELQPFLVGLAKDSCARHGTERPELRVQIRADQASRFEWVQMAMFCCSEAGIFKVEIGAAKMAEVP